MNNRHRGQITLTNLLVIVLVTIVYFTLLPTISTMADATCTLLLATPNSFTDVTVTFIRFLVLMPIIGIILTVVYWAKGQNEVVQR